MIHCQWEVVISCDSLIKNPERPDNVKFLVGVVVVAAAAAAAATAVYEKSFVTPFSDNLQRTQDESSHQTKQW